MTEPPRFHVIDGTPAPDTPKERMRKRVRAMPKPAYMVQCPRCGGREVVQGRIGMFQHPGRPPSGGTKTWLCVICLLGGERVVVA